MALILFGSYMVRYPLAGNLSCFLQWLYGFRQLGHDVYLVEKSLGWDCYDPSQKSTGDDFGYGLTTVSALLARFGLDDRICFVDAAGNYHGLSAEKTRGLFKAADLYIDVGAHGAWADLSSHARRQVLIEQEPGHTQMRLMKAIESGTPLQHYDAYYTNGMNVAGGTSDAPDCGVRWRLVSNPVALDMYGYCPPPSGGALTTVMNWQSHKPLEYKGRVFGQKDVEFSKFRDLPRRVSVPLEVAVSGRGIPVSELRESGWRLRDAQETTMSFDGYQRYIRESLGEFSVCKNVFVATRSGWFSDRTAAYLASGRPAVIQDTGFSQHLPCGEGLFAVNTVEEAADAIESLAADPVRHSRRARELAAEYLDTRKVLSQFLDEALEVQRA